MCLHFGSRLSLKLKIQPVANTVSKRFVLNLINCMLLSHCYSSNIKDCCYYTVLTRIAECRAWLECVLFVVQSKCHWWHGQGRSDGNGIKAREVTPERANVSIISRQIELQLGRMCVVCNMDESRIVEKHAMKCCYLLRIRLEETCNQISSQLKTRRFN